MTDIRAVFYGRRILVVEDNILLAMELMEELEKIGEEPIGPMTSVTVALHAVRTYNRIDAVLMNVDLGGEASVPVADALTERHIPFLFITGDVASFTNSTRTFHAIRSPPTCRCL